MDIDDTTIYMGDGEYVIYHSNGRKEYVNEERNAKLEQWKRANIRKYYVDSGHHARLEIEYGIGNGEW